MLISVDVRNERDQLLTLPLEESDNGFSIREIAGLDPVQAQVVSSSFAQIDGEQFMSVRREKRNIIMGIGLESVPVYSVRQLRQQLYQFFMPEKWVNLVFHLDDPINLGIRGMIETFGSPYFVADPQVGISILCFDPDFYELTSIAVPGVTVSDSTQQKITYAGSVETGFTLSINISQNLSALTVYLQNSEGKLEYFDFKYAMLAGDVLNITTISGKKEVMLLRNRTLISVLYGMDPTSSWLNLTPGDNFLRVLSSVSGMTFTLTYTNKYGAL